MIAAPVDLLERALWHLELCPELLYADQRELPVCVWHDHPLDSEEYDDYPDEDRTCPYCNGDGGDPWNDYILECPQCLGEGVRW